MRLQDLRPGQTYYAPGLDMNCYPTVERVTFIGPHHPPIERVDFKGQTYTVDCITESNGIRMKTSAAVMNTPYTCCDDRYDNQSDNRYPSIEAFLAMVSDCFGVEAAEDLNLVEAADGYVYDAATGSYRRVLEPVAEVAR